MEKTLVILKPECWENCIMGSVLKYFENNGLRPVQMKMLDMKSEIYVSKMRDHYADCVGKYGQEITNDIITRMTRGPCVFMVYEGHNICQIVRNIIGPTDPDKAPEGTIRGDMCSKNHLKNLNGDVSRIKYNVVHGSDGPMSAEREIKLWFE